MKRIIIILMLYFAVQAVFAQNFEDVFNAFVQQNEQSFNSFTDSINQQFAKAMEANMRTFPREKPRVVDAKPKPATIPKVENEEDSQKQPSVPTSEPIDSQKAKEKSLPFFIQPNVRSQETHPQYSENPNRIEFYLFGENIQYDRNPFPEKLAGTTPKDVSEFWIHLSESDYAPLLQTCRVLRNDRAFNDWATYQLFLEMVRHIYPNQYNEQAVMLVFLLDQIGLEAKVGFGEESLFCLLAVEQQLYGVSFTDITENRYYVFELDPELMHHESNMSFYTYDIPFPEPTKNLDMNVTQSLRSAEFPDIVDSAINISTSMIELFSTYPQVEITIYANARPSSVFCQSVEQVFRPYLRDLTPVEAVGFLLSYVQYGFDYDTDEDQFSCEKPFFCEENFYYPHNDCEDRSVLFAFLVRYLLHLDVVLIDYPGHMATAVHFPANVPGTSVQYNGKCYIICDPTYIGASVGKEMPDFKPEDRTVIPIGR